MASKIIIDKAKDIDLIGREKTIFIGDKYYKRELDGTLKEVFSETDHEHVDMLTITGRLAEFSTEQAKHDARQNLNLNNIDCGTFN